MFGYKVEVGGTNIVNVTEYSERKVLDIKTGEIVGVYDEQSLNIKRKVMIDDNSFINSRPKSSCCGSKNKPLEPIRREESQSNHKCNCGAATKAKASKSGSSCCHKAPSKKSILNQYFRKHKFEFVDNNQEAKREALRKRLKPFSDCKCGEDCKCEDCIVHRLMDQKDQPYHVPEVPEGHGTTGCGATENGTGGTNGTNGTNGTYSTNGTNSTNGTIGSMSASYMPEILDLSLPTLPPYPECICGDDCTCYNCETHGIIDGIRLDDLFV